MVGDDQVNAELPGASRGLGAANAAIHGHDQLDALSVQTVDRRGLQAVAIGQAFGNEMRDVRAEQLEGPAKDHRRGDAVHVVVAVHGNPLAIGDRRGEPIHRAFEAGEPERVVELFERRIQET